MLYPAYERAKNTGEVNKNAFQHHAGETCYISQKHWYKRSSRFMSKQLKTVPKFANEADEQAFWEKHGSTDYLDWTTAQRVVLPNLKPTAKSVAVEY